jgi:hypothetical protein
MTAREQLVLHCAPWHEPRARRGSATGESDVQAFASLAYRIQRPPRTLTASALIEAIEVDGVWLGFDAGRPANLLSLAGHPTGAKQATRRCAWPRTAVQWDALTTTS